MPCGKSQYGSLALSNTSHFFVVILKRVMPESEISVVTLSALSIGWLALLPCASENWESSLPQELRKSIKATAKKIAVASISVFLNFIMNILIDGRLCSRQSIHLQ
jgi:hypothetical protein